MNLRTVLRRTTNGALLLMALAALGTVVWVIDEELGWDILPDWIEAGAVAGVIVAGTLTLFSLVASLMCSVAVIAESAAARAEGGGAPEGKPLPRRLKAALGGLLLLVAGGLYGFHRVDVIRATRAVASRRAEHSRRYHETRATLAGRMPSIVASFTPDMRAQMARRIEPAAEADLSRMLAAVRDSSPGNPEVSLLVRAEAPYQYQVIRATGAVKTPSGDYAYLERRHLIDLPTVWERDTVAALINGAELDVPHGRSGAFIDTRKPCVWGAIRHGDVVVGLVLLRDRSERWY